jgi:hypothetical protein
MIMLYAANSVTLRCACTGIMYYAWVLSWKLGDTRMTALHGTFTVPVSPKPKLEDLYYAPKAEPELEFASEGGFKKVLY